jgi:hypothetical protein
MKIKNICCVVGAEQQAVTLNFKNDFVFGTWSI